jgi:hypothetical protein
MIHSDNPRKPKSLTREQLAARQAQAVTFTRDVVGDDDLADELESLSLEEYGQRRGIEISNPDQKEGKSTMQKLVVNPGKSKAELLEELAEVRQTVDQLQQQLNALNSTPSSNPRGNQSSTAADLLAEQIHALREEKKELEGKLDEILEIAAAPEDGSAKTEDEMIGDLNAIIDVVQGDDEGEE